MKLKPIVVAMLSAALLMIAVPNAFVAAATAPAAGAAVINPAPASPAATTSKKNSTAIVNINTADAATLQTLERIGPKRAAAIIAYRQQNGPFQAVADLSKVKDVSASIVTENQARLVVG